MRHPTRGPPEPTTQPPTPKRREFLPGPQGTLYGASSQAGTVRLITNKPVYNEFQAGFDVMRSGDSGKVVLDWAG